MTASDYVGIATLIGALGAAIVSIVVALRTNKIATTVDETRAAVHTSNGATIGELVETNQVRNVAQDIADPPAP